MFAEVHMLVIPLPDTANDWQGDTKIANLFKTPEQINGGGITVTKAFLTNQAATGAGTSFSIALLNYGTAGTALAGTVAAPLGGTASPWGAGVPKEFTISDGYLAPGEWLVAAKDEDNSSDPTRAILNIHYVMGV